MKRMKVVFFDNEQDKRLLASQIAALEDPVLKARFDYTIEQDVEAKTTTLWFWHRRKEGEQL